MVWCNRTSSHPCTGNCVYFPCCHRRCVVSVAAPAADYLYYKGQRYSGNKRVCRITWNELTSIKLRLSFYRATLAKYSRRWTMLMKFSTYLLCYVCMRVCTMGGWMERYHILWKREGEWAWGEVLGTHRVCFTAIVPFLWVYISSSRLYPIQSDIRNWKLSDIASRALFSGPHFWHTKPCGEGSEQSLVSAGADLKFTQRFMKNMKERLPGKVCTTTYSSLRSLWWEWWS